MNLDFFEFTVIILMSICVLALLLNFFAYMVEPALDAYRERKLERRKTWERQIEERIKNLENKTK